MPDPDGRDPSINAEPALNQPPIVPDETSELDMEPARSSDVSEAIGDTTSVRDEPALAWGASMPDAAPGFAERFAQRRQATGWWRGIAALGAAALLAGPFGAGGALLDGLFAGGQGSGLAATVLFGPIAEEMLKVALLLWLLETRPWLIPTPVLLVVAAAVAGLGFGLVENLIYVNVYVPDGGAAFLRWRWGVCTALHVVCSTIAGFGLLRMWTSGPGAGQPAQVARAFPFFVTAMVVHGVYNAAVSIWPMLD